MSKEEGEVFQTHFRINLLYLTAKIVSDGDLSKVNIINYLIRFGFCIELKYKSSILTFI